APILLSPAVSAAVSISGTAQDGQTLTASATGTFAAYQWQVLEGGTWIDIAGATEATHVVQSWEDGRNIRVQVTDGAGNNATSAATDAVLDAAGNRPVYETAVLPMIGNGQSQYVFGSAFGTTVASGGEQNIYLGGTATATALNTGGIQVDWGSATNTTISGGTQYVAGTATG